MGNISKGQLTALQSKLEASKAILQNNGGNLTKDDLLGDLLYTPALDYHAQLSSMDYTMAHMMSVAQMTLPSETVFSTQLKAAWLMGIPITVSSDGFNMDAKYLMNVVKAKDGNNDTAKQFMLSSGMMSSVLEHYVPEKLLSTEDNPVEGISSVKALKIANDQGIPILTLNQPNIGMVLPQLQIDQQVKSDIEDAVNAGKFVTVSMTNITYNGWTGCGYIVINPKTGAGAYMISGGLNGMWLFVLWANCFLLAAVGGPEGFVAATILGIYGTYMIKKAYGMDTSINIPTTVIDIIAQIGIAAGIAALSAAGLAALPFVLGCIILYTAAAMLDFTIFNYTYNYLRQRYRC